QPAVLTEYDQGIGLGHDQVAVAGHQVSPGSPVDFHQLDGLLGTQTGALVEDLDPVPRGPVNSISRQQAAAVAFGLARVGPGGGQLAGLDIEEQNPIAGGYQPPPGHAQKMSELDLLGK